MKPNKLFDRYYIVEDASPRFYIHTILRLFGKDFDLGKNTNFSRTKILCFDSKDAAQAHIDNRFPSGLTTKQTLYGIGRLFFVLFFPFIPTAIVAQFTNNPLLQLLGFAIGLVIAIRFTIYADIKFIGITWGELNELAERNYTAKQEKS